MERESEPNQASRIDARRYYEGVFRYLSDELQNSPELQEELVDFTRYIALLQALAPFTLPSLERERRIEAIDYELERSILPDLPVTLPPPHRKISVGEHMTISTGFSALEFWPAYNLSFLTLADGSLVSSETSIGRIDIVRNLPKLDPKANPLAFARVLFKSSVRSLTELAHLCEISDRRLSHVEAFAGISHLARVGGKLGFTVFEIEDAERRSSATEVSKKVADYVAGNNIAWQELRANYKPARIAFISRQHLIDTFGSSALRNA